MKRLLLRAAKKNDGNIFLPDALAEDQDLDFDGVNTTN